MRSQAIVETGKAPRYLQQLCKHFAHRVPAGGDDRTGWIDLPMGRVDMLAEASTLAVSLSAQSPEQLASLEEVLQRHLERFAFREDLHIRWTAIADAD